LHRLAVLALDEPSLPLLVVSAPPEGAVARRRQPEEAIQLEVEQQGPARCAQGHQVEMIWGHLVPAGDGTNRRVRLAWGRAGLSRRLTRGAQGDRQTDATQPDVFHWHRTEVRSHLPLPRIKHG